MRLHRFYISESIGSKKTITVIDENTLHQWKKVFRLGAGDTVVLFDGSGNEYASEITLLSKEKAELEIKEIQEVPSIAREVWLCVALIKKDHFEWIVEKATELGVTHIVPILAERSEKKGLALDRLVRIATEASEQSGRGTVPHVYEPVSLQDAVVLVDGVEKYAFDPAGSVLVDTERTGTKPAAIFIGPEGGWTEQEITFFTQEGIKRKTLGQQILRAETAAVAVSTLFLLF